MQKSDWVRVLRVIVGLIAIVASAVALAFPGIAVITLLFLLSIVLLCLGVARIAHSIKARPWPKGLRILYAIAGVVALILGAIVLAFPLLAIATLVFLLAIALLAYGIVSLFIGASTAAGLVSKWKRALLLIVGALSVIFSIIVLLFPGIGLVTLVAGLAVSFLLNGIESMSSGLE
jgi:uncharacterized membrane protein HdeD (DUF308 family)